MVHFEKVSGHFQQLKWNISLSHWMGSFGFSWRFEKQHFNAEVKKHQVDHIWNVTMFLMICARIEIELEFRKHFHTHKSLNS